jgi:hypothetical protein
MLAGTHNEDSQIMEEFFLQYRDLDNLPSVKVDSELFCEDLLPVGDTPLSVGDFPLPVDDFPLTVEELASPLVMVLERDRPLSKKMSEFGVKNNYLVP